MASRNRRLAAPASNYGSRFPAFLTYGKTTAVILGILLGTIVFEPARLVDFPSSLVRPADGRILPVLLLFVDFQRSGTLRRIIRTSMHCMNWLLPYWSGDFISPTSKAIANWASA